MLLSIGKRSTLVKIWGTADPPPPPPNNPLICMGLCWNCLTNIYPAIALMFYDSQDTKYAVFETGVKSYSEDIPLEFKASS